MMFFFLAKPRLTALNRYPTSSALGRPQYVLAINGFEINKWMQLVEVHLQVHCILVHRLYDRVSLEWYLVSVG